MCPTSDHHDPGPLLLQPTQTQTPQLNISMVVYTIVTLIIQGLYTVVQDFRNSVTIKTGLAYLKEMKEAKVKILNLVANTEISPMNYLDCLDIINESVQDNVRDKLHHSVVPLFNHTLDLCLVLELIPCLPKDDIKSAMDDLADVVAIAITISGNLNKSVEIEDILPLWCILDSIVWLANQRGVSTFVPVIFYRIDNYSKSLVEFKAFWFITEQKLYKLMDDHYLINSQSTQEHHQAEFLLSKEGNLGWGRHSKDCKKRKSKKTKKSKRKSSTKFVAKRDALYDFVTH